MRDGRTRRLEREDRDESFEQFRSRWQASIVVLTGAQTGCEHLLEKPRISLGRGPGVDLAFEDTAMSREHAALEFSDGGFRLRDLGSTNGTRLNGAEIQARELKSGDRFELGEHVLQFVLEERRREPRPYVLPDA